MKKLDRFGLKVIFLIGMISLLQSCKQDYHGDGQFSYHRSPLLGLLWPPLIEVKMPEFDISKHVIKTYSLDSLPVSKGASQYSIFVVIPSAQSGDIERNNWGTFRVETKKNGKTIKNIHVDFSSMRNNRGGGGDEPFLNRLYIDTQDSANDVHFVVSSSQDHWEITVECSGFDSSKPVRAYILIRCGGE